MNHAQNIISLPDSINMENQNIGDNFKTVNISKDQWLGECLDDYLFKLRGIDQVVWIPKEFLRPSPEDHAFTACIFSEDMYCCARLTISNCIRMCLVGQHQVKGCHLLSYLT